LGVYLGMRIVVLGLILVLIPPTFADALAPASAFAEEGPAALVAAKAQLAHKDVARRVEGIKALGKIGSRAALEALLPWLEHPDFYGTRHTLSPIEAVFIRYRDRAVAIAVLESALLRPDIAVGHTWFFTRAALASKPETFDNPVWLKLSAFPLFATRVVESAAKRTKRLERLAAALPVKRASVVGPSLMLLVAFHHRSPHIAPATARAWLDLDRDEQIAMLGDEGWPLIRSDAVASVLLRTPYSTYPRSWLGGDPKSLALKRLVELGSAQARAEILADMRRPQPRLTHDALLALPDKHLPELEAGWRALLAKRQPRDLTALAHMADRYASDALLDVMLAVYRTNQGWACEFNAAALSCILKWDTEIGITEVSKALTRRGKGHTGCYRDLLERVLPHHWSPKAEALALAHLEDTERAVRQSAAIALTAAGSTQAASSVLALFGKLKADDPHECVLRYDLLFALAKREAWMAAPAIKKAFYSQLSESDFGMLRMNGS
jgi:hypothetical protein